MGRIFIEIDINHRRIIADVSKSTSLAIGRKLLVIIMMKIRHVRKIALLCLT